MLAEKQSSLGDFFNILPNPMIISAFFGALDVAASPILLAVCEHLQYWCNHLSGG